MNLTEHVKANKAAWWTGSLAGIATYLATRLVSEIRVPAFVALIRAIPPSAWLCICLLLLTAIAGLVSYCVSLLNENNPQKIRSKYILDDRTGVRERDGKFFCNSCLLKNPPVESQLYEMSDMESWNCGCCGGFYKPDSMKALFKRMDENLVERQRLAKEQQRLAEERSKMEQSGG